MLLFVSGWTLEVSAFGALEVRNQGVDPGPHQRGG